MTRTAGAKNILPFELRNSIASSPNSAIRHLASSANETVLEYFLGLLKHQRNYSNWLQSRHDDLISAKTELATIKNTGERGPKDGTFRKYKWYSEYLVLLEAINAFEVFYKRSLIHLATALRDYTPADRIKGNLDTRILWTAPLGVSAADLIFEHRLYHDLDTVDQATESLIQKKRYTKNSPKPPMQGLVRSLQVIFQIRHTLSHNHGLLTASDAGKLKVLGYNATVGEVIDPTKDDLAHVICDVLENEAKEFTKWLIDGTADYLLKLHTSSGIILADSSRIHLEDNIGTKPALTSLPWV